MKAAAFIVHCAMRQRTDEQMFYNLIDTHASTVEYTPARSAYDNTSVSYCSLLPTIHTAITPYVDGISLLNLSQTFPGNFV